MNDDKYIKDLIHCLGVYEQYLPQAKRRTNDPGDLLLDPRASADDTVALREIRERSVAHLRSLIFIITTLHGRISNLSEELAKYGNAPEYSALKAKHERIAQAYSDLVDKADKLGMLRDLQRAQSTGIVPQEVRLGDDGAASNETKI